VGGVGRKLPYEQVSGGTPYLQIESPKKKGPAKNTGPGGFLKRTYQGIGGQISERTRGATKKSGNKDMQKRKTKVLVGNQLDLHLTRRCHQKNQSRKSPGCGEGEKTRSVEKLVRKKETEHGRGVRWKATTKEKRKPDANLLWGKTARKKTNDKVFTATPALLLNWGDAETQRPL